MIRQKTLITLFLVGTALCARAAQQEGGAPLMTDLIDIPTADAVDHYGYNVNFRFYSGGGLLSKTAFGVLPRLNVGFGLDAEQFIGSGNVRLNRPTLNTKFRFFDGKRELPALALGFDGQGNFYNRKTDKYIQREKGLYLAGSEEAFVPDLRVHGGLNIYDFSKDDVFAFAGANYLYADLVGLMFEADNMMHRPRETRFNSGVRYYVTPTFSVDFGARDLWSARKPERIIRLSYFGSF